LQASEHSRHSKDASYSALHKSTIDNDANFIAHGCMSQPYFFITSCHILSPDSFSLSCILVAHLLH